MKLARSRAVLTALVSLCLCACPGRGSDPPPSEPPPTPPAAPTDLQAVALSATEVLLTWQDNSGTEVSFEVVRSVGGSAWSVSATLDHDVTTYLDTNCTANTEYHYMVQARDDANRVSQSDVATVTTPSPGLDPPQGLQATAISPTQVQLTWTDTTSTELGFSILRAVGSEALAPWASASQDATDLLDGTCTPATQYRYAVAAFDSVQTSSLSNVATVTTPSLPTSLTTPVMLSAHAVGPSQIIIAWQPIDPAATAVDIERSVDGQPFAALQTVSSLLTIFIDSGLTADTNHQYRIRARSATLVSDYSNIVQDTTWPLLAPVTFTMTAPPSSTTGNYDITITPNGGYLVSSVYTLQEAPTGQFATTTNYLWWGPFSGGGPFHYSFTNKPPGTYHYRLMEGTQVQRSNAVSVQVAQAGPTTATFYADADNTIAWTTSSAQAYVMDTCYSTGLDGVGSYYDILTYTSDAMIFATAVQFDIGAFISGKTINQATFRMFVNLSAPTVPDPLTVKAFAAPWSSNTITWNNQPPRTGPEIWASPSLSYSVPVEWDITSIVQQWANGTIGCHGLRVMETVPASWPLWSQDRTTWFDAADSYDAWSRRPQLVISYQ